MKEWKTLFKEDEEFRKWGVNWMREEQGLKLEQMAEFWDLNKARHANLEEEDQNYREWGRQKMAEEGLQKE